jgi:hypothetical protein
MTLTEAKAQINGLKFLSCYTFEYNNSPESIVKNTVFTVKIYSDANHIKPPLIIISEPVGNMGHVVQNASEWLVKIIFSIENKHLKNYANLEKTEHFIDFKNALTEELIAHSALLPAKGSLNALQSTTMLSGIVIGFYNLLANIVKTVTRRSNLKKALAKSLFAEHSQHALGRELINVTTYANGSREEIGASYNSQTFLSSFGINVHKP